MKPAADREISESAFPSTLPIEEQLRFLLRYAILAPSARNAQPWRFVVEANIVRIYPEPSRWHPIADPHRRELNLGLGCALENLVIAAEHYGFRVSVVYSTARLSPDPVVIVEFAPAGSHARIRRGLALETILRRRTAHGRYAGRAVVAEHQQALLSRIEAEDVVLILRDGVGYRKAIAGLYRRAAGMLLGREDYRRELSRAVGDGSLGTPWPLSSLAALALASQRGARRLERLELAALRDTALFGLVASRDDTATSQIRSGQLLERVWLTATASDLGVQPLSIILETEETRGELAEALGLPRGFMAQELVRIGHPRRARGRPTPRLPVTAVVEVPGLHPPPLLLAMATTPRHGLPAIAGPAGGVPEPS